MPRRRPEPSSSPSELESEEESSEEEVDPTQQLLEIQKQRLTECLTRIENMARMQVSNMDHKVEDMLTKFDNRMASFAREEEENKKERTKHEAAIRKLQNEIEKLKIDQAKTVDDLNARYQRELKELNDHHERRYRNLEETLHRERERAEKAQNRERERARQEAD